MRNADIQEHTEGEKPKREVLHDLKYSIIMKWADAKTE
jgi:hypothetical protein